MCCVTPAFDFHTVYINEAHLILLTEAKVDKLHNIYMVLSHILRQKHTVSKARFVMPGFAGKHHVSNPTYTLHLLKLYSAVIAMFILEQNITP